MEQRALEESLNQLLESLTANTKALKELDSQLLDRLSHSSGNLLDDLELIEVLANTKAKAKEVEKKLKDAQEKKAEVTLRRQEKKSQQVLPSTKQNNVPRTYNILFGTNKQECVGFCAVW